MRVGIVGGGISGLACAYYLERAGYRSRRFRSHPGGLIGTVRTSRAASSKPDRRAGSPRSRGPNNSSANSGWATNSPARTTPVAAPTFFATAVSSRCRKASSWWSRPASFRCCGPSCSPGARSSAWATEIFRNPKALPDRSVSEFVADHFGREAVDYLAEPLLAGVYGGSPDYLSAVSVLPKFVEHEQRFGSVVVGALREKAKATGQPVFKSLRNGMGSLIDALRERVTVIPASVESIQPAWRVFAASEWHDFDQIVLCCGANRAAPLMAPIDARAAELLASIPHTRQRHLDVRLPDAKTCRARSTPSDSWCPSGSGTRSWRARGSRPSGRAACPRGRPCFAASRPIRTSPKKPCARI